MTDETEDFFYIHIAPEQCARFDTNYTPDEYDGICCTDVEETFIFVITNGEKISVYQTMYPNWTHPLEEELRWVGKDAKIHIIPGSKTTETSPPKTASALIDMFQDRALNLEKMPVAGSVHPAAAGPAVIVDDEANIFTERDPAQARLLAKRCGPPDNLFRSNANALNLLLLLATLKDLGDLGQLRHDVAFDSDKFTALPPLRGPARRIYDDFSSRGRVPDPAELLVSIPGGLPFRLAMQRTYENLTNFRRLAEDQFKAEDHKAAKASILNQMEIYTACGMKLSLEMAGLLRAFGDASWKNGDFVQAVTSLENSYKLLKVLLGPTHERTVEHRCQFETILCSADCIETYV